MANNFAFSNGIFARLIADLAERGFIRPVFTEQPVTYEELLKRIQDSKTVGVIENVLAESGVKKYIDEQVPYWTDYNNIDDAKNVLQDTLMHSLMFALGKVICDAVYSSGGDIEVANARIQAEAPRVIQLFKELYRIE